MNTADIVTVIGLIIGLAFLLGGARSVFEFFTHNDIQPEWFEDGTTYWPEDE